MLEEMVASFSGSRYTVLHQTDSSGKIYHYENVKYDIANACLKQYVSDIECVHYKIHL